MTGSALVVRRFLPGEWSLYRDLRLRSLQDSPDAFGSTYALECDRADGDWAERLARGASAVDELPLVAEWKGEPSGLAWARIDATTPEVAHLYQMWVASECRRNGIGRALLDAAASWSRSMGAERIELDVTCSNEPAVRLYEEAGFVAHGESTPLRLGETLRAQPMCRPLGEDSSRRPTT
jgi:ribosomal protein S18 acetylase RimI-like enzyme